MRKIEIFDPIMCHAKGDCTQHTDPEFLRIVTVINTLQEKGIEIKRYNHASQPLDFVFNEVICDFLLKNGAEMLPVTLVDGQIAKTRGYPTDEELSSWLEINVKTSDIKEGRCGKTGCC